MTSQGARMLHSHFQFITMNRLTRLLSLAATVGALYAAPAAMAAQDQDHQGGSKAMFATKAEAEASAKQFHCQGAHKMGNHWMPCSNHGAATGSPSAPMAH
jgi:hypothetical protein